MGTNKRTQTVEQTGKIWKFQILLSSLLTCASVVMFAVAVSMMDDAGRQWPFAMSIVAVLAFAIGLCWFLFARIGSWWFHG